MFVWVCLSLTCYSIGDDDGLKKRDGDDDFCSYIYVIWWCKQFVVVWFLLGQTELMISGLCMQAGGLMLLMIDMYEVCFNVNMNMSAFLVGCIVRCRVAHMLDRDVLYKPWTNVLVVSQAMACRVESLSECYWECIVWNWNEGLLVVAIFKPVSREWCQSILYVSHALSFVWAWYLTCQIWNADIFCSVFFFREWHVVRSWLVMKTWCLYDMACLTKD